jgi:endo-1,4-beta-xylanase
MNRHFLSYVFAFTCLTACAGDTPKDGVAVAINGTPKVDGEVDAIWKDAPKVEVNKPITDLLLIDREEMAIATVQLMWDQEHVYALWHVKDSKLSAEPGDPWEQDSVELFLDQGHQQTTYYESDDGQYRVNFKGDLSGQGEGYDESNLTAATSKTDDGYIVEMSVRATETDLKPAAKLGLELQVNDDHNSGSRDAVAKWYHVKDDSWESTSNFGTLELK